MQPGEDFQSAISNVDLKSNPELGHVAVIALPSMTHDVLTGSTRCDRGIVRAKPSTLCHLS